MSRSRVLPIAGLLASLALVWSATAGVLWNARTPEALADERLAEAERLVFFRVDAGRALRMQLPAGVEALRISTHLVLPDGTVYSPERQYLYGVRLRIVDPDGNVVLERPLFTRSRQSKAERVDGRWLKESAFSIRTNVQLADHREFTLELPANARAQHGTLELFYPGPTGALLLRAYARIENAAPLFAARVSTRLQRAEERVERATYLPWEKLSYATQQELVNERWQRLDALGEPGEDFLTEPVYHSGFRLPLVEVARAEEESLPAGRAIAVNVRGPAQLTAWVWRARPDQEPSARATVTLTRVSGLGELPEEHELEVPAAEPLRHPIEVPAGVHTLTLRNGSALDLRYTIEGPRAAWIAPEPLLAEANAAHTALVPDARRSEAWVTGGSCEPLTLELGAPLDDAARLFRIDARTVIDAAPVQPSAVQVTFLDERGRQVGETGFETPAEEAPFDRADLPMMPSDRLPCGDGAGTLPEQTVEITEVLAPVSAAATARVFAPPTARRMIVRAASPTAVRLFGFVAHEQPAALEPPYADAAHALVGMRWRNAPVEGTSWRPLRPFNHRVLARAGARITLVRQVHLEPRGPAGAAVVARETTSLRPLGAPASRQLLELETTHSERPTARERTRASFARLEPNASRRVRFDARTPTRPELRLELDDPAALGQVVEVLVDGTPVRRVRLRTTRMRTLLPPLPPGTHDVLLQSPSSELVALLNRAPADGEPPLRMRTAYRVGDGLRVRVRKSGSDAVNLNAVVYTRSPDAGTLADLAITIDGGTPRRTSGVLVPRLTRAERTVVLPASTHEAAIPVGRAGERWYPHAVAIRLGEDLAPGVHEVRLTPTQHGDAWARFFVFAPDPAEREARQWNRLGWDEEDAP